MKMPVTKFSEFLSHRKDSIRIDDTQKYKRARVQLHWRGIVLRDQVEGMEIKTKEQQVARDGELLVAEIDAKVGGVGIVPPELDGAIVSSHYFLFEVNESKCLKKWLDFYIRSGGLEDQLTARGSTNYAAIRPHHVLNCEIPVPPVPEQRRIVGRIEELSAKIEEARGLRQEAEVEIDAILPSVLQHLHLPHGSVTTRISECSTMSTGTTPPSERSDYYGGVIQWYTPGDLEYQQRLGKSSRTLSEQALLEGKARMFEPGTVLLVAIGGSLGKVALAHERCSANQQITGIKFSTQILPEYGFWWMRRLGKDLMAAAPQATLPIINQRGIGSFEIVIPPLPEQRRIVANLDELQAQADALKRLQTETAKELDALMPSILSKAFAGEL